MKNLEETNSEIFDLVKKEKSVKYNGLYLRLKTSDLRIRESIAKLKTEYRLIFTANGKISLSKEGEKHDTFELYLKSLKKDPNKTHRTRQLIITSLSLLTAIIFGTLNFLSNKKIDSLESDKSVQTENYNLLESEFVHYKDSVNKHNTKTGKTTLNSELDTLQTKNSDVLKTE